MLGIDAFDLVPVNERHLQEQVACLAVLVAGKSPRAMQPALARLLDEHEHEPFSYLRWLQRSKQLDRRLRSAGTGQYDRINAALGQLCRCRGSELFDLAALERIPGVGMKTSRMILLYTQPAARVAAIDRHVRVWLDAEGYRIPSKSLTRHGYLALEDCFLCCADRHSLLPWQLDKKIWQSAVVPV